MKILLSGTSLKSILADAIKQRKGDYWSKGTDINVRSLLAAVDLVNIGGCVTFDTADINMYEDSDLNTAYMPCEEHTHILYDDEDGTVYICGDNNWRRVPVKRLRRLADVFPSGESVPLEVALEILLRHE